MDDRIAEIRKAVALQDDVESAVLTLSGMDWLVDPIERAFDAARAYADLLDSDALIIRRDEDGEWPATYDEDGYTTCCGWHRDHRGHRMNCVLAVQLDASSQGVEP